MIYTINTSNYTPVYRNLLAQKLKLNAISRLRNFPIRTAEKLLDEYLKTNYKMSLQYACYLIIINSKIEETENEITVSLNDKQLEKIARIITFGTGRLTGSRLIPFMFTKV